MDGEIRQFVRRWRSTPNESGNRLVFQLCEQMEGFLITAIPGRGEDRTKRVAHQRFQMPFPSDKVVAYLQGCSGRAEFLFFPLRFMVHMSPPMLVPAPERRGLSSDPLQILPAGPGKPRRNHRQTEGRAMMCEEIHEPNEVGSRNGRVVGAEKNTNGIVAMTVFKGRAETVIHSGGQIGWKATP